MSGHRKKKLEELIKRIIGDVLIKEIKDPRIGFATVYSVNLSKDYAVADVNISIIGDDKQKKKSMTGLNAASGFIRFQVGKQIKLRIVPEIRFHLDSTIESGVDLVNLIDSVNQQENETDNIIDEKSEN